jgi:hypothetical protein
MKYIALAAWIQEKNATYNYEVDCKPCTMYQYKSFTSTVLEYFYIVCHVSYVPVPPNDQVLQVSYLVLCHKAILAYVDGIFIRGEYKPPFSISRLHWVLGRRRITPVVEYR